MFVTDVTRDGCYVVNSTRYGPRCVQATLRQVGACVRPQVPDDRAWRFIAAVGSVFPVLTWSVCSQGLVVMKHC